MEINFIHVLILILFMWVYEKLNSFLMMLEENRLISRLIIWVYNKLISLFPVHGPRQNREETQPVPETGDGPMIDLNVAGHTTPKFHDYIRRRLHQLGADIRIVDAATLLCI